MMRRIVFIVFLMFAFGCGSENEKTKIPENIIPPDKMVPIIVDFHLIEASVILGQQQKEDVNQITNHRYSSVMKKHKVTRKQLAESLIFYTNHMKDLEDIYKEVVVELNTTQGRIISK